MEAADPGKRPLCCRGGANTSSPALPGPCGLHGNSPAHPPLALKWLQRDCVPIKLCLKIKLRARPGRACLGPSELIHGACDISESPWLCRGLAAQTDDPRALMHVSRSPGNRTARGSAGSTACLDEHSHPPPPLPWPP